MTSAGSPHRSQSHNHSRSHSHSHGSLHHAGPLGLGPPIAISTKIESPPFLEQDIEIVNQALENNGLTMEDVTAEGFACLLEEARKYALSLITDAADYAMHSHSSDTITPSDLMLAKEMQDDGMDVVDMEALARIAQETNRRMLPPIPDHCYNGIVLPSTEYTLLGRAYDVVCRPDDEEEGEDGAGGKKRNNHETVRHEMGMGMSKKDEKSIPIPSYGARRGMKQVQISLQSSNSKSASGAAPGGGDASDLMDIS